MSYPARVCPYCLEPSAEAVAHDKSVVVTLDDRQRYYAHAACHLKRQRVLARAEIRRRTRRFRNARKFIEWLVSL